MRVLKPGDMCEVEGCEEEADNIAYSRVREKVIFCCDPHTCKVVDEGSPEYHDYCENCGCKQGVN